MTKIDHLSASQLTTFDPDQTGGCNRKWWFRQVARLPDVETESQRRGKELHGHLEGFLRDGVSDELSPLEAEMLWYVPPPYSALEVERRIEMEIVGIPVVGYIDVLGCGQYITPEGELVRAPGVVEILDWKTTSNMKYAKSGAELAETAQMVVYAKWVQDTYAPALIRLSHVYGQVKGRGVVRKVTTLISPDTLARRWRELEGVARQIQVVAQATDVTDVKPNYAACNVYGGCPYKSACPRGDDSPMLLDDIMKSLSAVKTDPTEAPPAPMVCIECKAPAELVRPDTWWHGPGPCRMADNPLGAARVSVLPPDAPKAGESGPIAEPIPPAELATMSPAIQEAHAEVMARQASAPEGKKRGRPKKTTHTTAPEAVEAIAPDTTAPSAPAGIHLFVDVTVDGIPTTSLDPLITTLCDALCERFSVSDIRCGDGDLGFGKWKGALAALVRANPPPPGAYSLSYVRESEIKQVVLEALRPACATVVRGVG